MTQWLERLTAYQQVPGSNPGVPSFAHTPLHLRTWKTEIEPVRQRILSTRAVPICCAKARACFRRTLTRCIVLLTDAPLCLLGPIIRRLRLRVPLERCAIALILVVPKTTDVAKVGHNKKAVVEQTRLPSQRSKRVLQRRYTQVSEPLLFDKGPFVFVLQKQKSRCAATRPTLKLFFFVCVCIINTLPPLFFVLSRTRHGSRSHEADAH